jgi:hypothetical protein
VLRDEVPSTRDRNLMTVSYSDEGMGGGKAAE